MTYSAQTTAISALGTGGFSWHMATGDDMASLLDNVGEHFPYGSTPYPDASQITEAFFKTHVSYGSDLYMGRYDVPSTGIAGRHDVLAIETRLDGSDNIYFVSYLGQHSAYDSYAGSTYESLGAWVVADAVAGGSDPAPEPTTILLFGFGLLGLSCVSRKRKE